ncbi:O-Antigen Polymerase family protein [gamma proteobacterium NOR5-3]|nr:O-Antigen Polymerase family protein [gamma proteobacterium NOR5-3]
MSLRHGPVLIFMVYQLDYFLNPQNKWWGQYLPFESAQFYLVLTMIIVFLFSIKKYSRNTVFAHSQFLLIFLSICMFALATFNAPLQQYHLDSLDAFATIGVVVFLLVKFCSEGKHIHWVVDAYLFSSFMLSFYIFGWGRNSNGRVEGVGMVDAPDANGVAAALAPTIVIFIAHALSDKRWLFKFAYAVGLVFSLNAMILINSRGGFLGVAVGTAYFFGILLTSAKLPTRQKAVIILASILLAGGFLRLADTSFLNRMMSIKQESALTESRETGSTRVFFWMAAWEMAKDHPFGAGAGGFQYHGGDYIPDNVSTGGSRSRAVHSTWFEVLSESGYAGLIIFVSMIVATFRAFEATRKALLKRQDLANSIFLLSLSSSFISFVVAMTFINRMRAEVLYWLIGLSICCVNVWMLETKKKT